jgi:predicted enzyme related to lactoylglutathione lyase
MTHSGLIGAVLYAKDLQQLAAFYAAVAGLELAQTQDGFAVLGRPPSQLVIVRIPQAIADAISITRPPMVREDTPIKLVFAIDDIAHARARALDLGGAVNPAEHEWQFDGATVCDGHDPEGNVFQLRQR